MDRPRDGAGGRGRARRPRLRARPFELVAVAATALTAAFLALPLFGLFLRGDLAAGLTSPEAADALRLSFVTSAVSLGLMVVVGTPVAWLLALHRFRGRDLLVTLLELPLVLPPAVAGIALFAAFGRRGLFGDELAAAGVTLPFTTAAVVMAMTFVASPLYLRQAQAAFASVDPDLVAAARTLGAGPWRTFIRVGVPTAAAGLGAGAALGWARALGEFGATILFAGSLQGVTQTAPIAIYGLFEQDFETAVGLGAVLVAISAAVLLATRLLVRGGLARSAPS